MKATGHFDVDLRRLDPFTTGSKEVTVGRMAIDKTYHGDLQARSRGEMLTATTGVQGSAGYVAIEQVQGTLRGRRGTFVLQHYGMMDRGQRRLILEVVPDSGTGELTGLSGQMTLTIEDGDHFYELEYELGDA
ncbi:MAG TPA: DUF3224 domain-containing protein [Candidatus Sulfomarinibacteraceae bacterium]|nr:DUF3224 domain-containing protein [Candidatus Sulfomarinibacteraceae bacterium]